MEAETRPESGFGEARGLVGLVERAWSGNPGALAWTKLLLPLAALYAAGSARSRAGAAARRRAHPALHVVSVGGLTVGGAGKTSVARWLAREAAASGARPAVLLRGHGRRRDAAGTFVVPDFEDYPLRAAFDRAGDEAAAHRAGLPHGVTIIADRNRYRAAGVAASGYGATVLVLDDGWEQGTLGWDDLWVAVDPRSPVGNGSMLPAGPLRRPAATLREARVLAFVLEGGEEEIPGKTVAWAKKMAPAAAVLRFARVLDGTSAIGETAIEPWRSGGPRTALLSGVGSPERLTRFARAAGIDLVCHATFPDHARWSAPELLRALRAAARAGAALGLITEKDEPRWPSMPPTAIPVRVLRTSLRPLDPVDTLVERIRGMAARGTGVHAEDGVLRR